MSAAFLYLATGAAIVGFLAGRGWGEDPIGYAVVVVFWPFIAITVAASMIADAFRGDA